MQRDALFLGEIVDAAQQVVELAGPRGADELAADPIVSKVVLWNLTVIGEAANALSASPAPAGAGL